MLLRLLPPMHTLSQHFAYALGRLGTLEDQLLKQTDVDRLLGASSGEEAVRMLRDIEFLPTPERDESFQETLNTGTRFLKENVERTAPPAKHFIFDILWLPEDRARLSFALKEKHGFVSAIAVKPDPPVSSGFTVALDDPFDSPRAIDDAVSDAVNAQALALVKRSGSAMIERYVKRRIELEILRSQMRSKKDADIRTIAFEQEGIAQIGDLLAEMRRVVLGPEALFSYAARTLNHIALLKVLLTGKVNNLPIQEVKSLLPPLL